MDEETGSSGGMGLGGEAGARRVAMLTSGGLPWRGSKGPLRVMMELGGCGGPPQSWEGVRLSCALTGCFQGGGWWSESCRVGSRLCVGWPGRGRARKAHRKLPGGPRPATCRDVLDMRVLAGAGGDPSA